ncbi:hypothetical protein K490DRAFT_57237 [Saccharata proteae CBS 121410]|uniref:Uncharacterized protein n=1 Tax=Saccharata proteae CBS 121410 TaxID=1314787 RepID=A0A9P4HVE1_9PEZI|nr:hypothetical protein K490DRAFT_57237 [Saccharata proteae CBS 121410]
MSQRGLYIVPAEVLRSSKLFAMMRKLLSHLHLLKAESLEGFPWYLAQKIWKAVQASELESPHVLETFLTAYHDEPDFRKEIAMRCRMYQFYDVEGQIPSIIKFGVKLHLEWLAGLFLEDYRGDRPELIKISKIRNLGAVHIDGPFDAFGPDDLASWAPMDDRVVKAWVEDAKDNDLLSKLRLVSFSRLKGITRVSLSLLREIPSVNFCNLTDCGLEKTGDNIDGWKRLTRAEAEHRLGEVVKISRTLTPRLFGIMLRNAIVPEIPPPILFFYNRISGMEKHGQDCWFERIADPVPNQPQLPAKHKAEGPSQPGLKKRKMRDNKAGDLNKILGDFGVS